MMKTLSLYLFQLALSMILLSGCETSESTDKPDSIRSTVKTFSPESLLNLPFENLVVETDWVEVDGANGGAYFFKSGTSIIVPAQAFVNSEGQIIDGKVKITLKEYESLGEIIASGISMKYDSGGVEHDFKSAGMFMLEGFINNAPVAVAEGKSLTVNSMSYAEDTPCYNFYSMDESGEWNYQQTPKAHENPDKKGLKSIEEPPESTEDDIVFDINVKGSNKSLKAYEKYLWKYDGNRPDTIDQKELALHAASKAELINVGDSKFKFLLNFTVNGKNFSVPVTPVLSPSQYTAELSNFEKSLDSIKQYEESFSAYMSGDYIRTVEIGSFGLYNYDIIHRCEREQLIVSFDYGSAVPSELCDVYLVSETDNTVVRYFPAQYAQFSYNPKVDNKIVAILPKDRVAVLNTKDFIDQVKGSNGETVEFKMKVLEEDFGAVLQLDDLIKSL